jgi:magnesium transporter
VIVDNAIYVDGHRTAEPVTLGEAYEAVRNRRGVAWIGLYKPTEEEFSSVAGEFGLHGLAVEDATDAHHRPATWMRRREWSSAKSTSLWEKTSW